MLHRAERRTTTTKVVRQTEAEAIAFVIGKAVGLETGSASAESALMFQLLRQIQSRGDAAIVYDPAREFVKRFYDPSRGDVILDPLDKRCPY
jgi:hypothetical protein